MGQGGIGKEGVGEGGWMKKRREGLSGGFVGGVEAWLGKELEKVI